MANNYLNTHLPTPPEEPASFLWRGDQLYCDSAYLRRCALEHVGFGDFATAARPQLAFIRRDGSGEVFPDSWIGRPHHVCGPTEAVKALHDQVLGLGNVRWGDVPELTLVQS